MNDNSKTPLKIWFYEFLKCHLHDAKTFCMKTLQNLATPVISGDNSRAHKKPDLPRLLEYHFMTLPRQNLEPHLRNFPASQSNLFNCPNHRKDSSKIARCYAIPLLPPDCTLSQPL